MSPGFRGWRIAAVAFACQAAAFGTTLGGFGVLLEPVETELGLSRAEVSLGLALNNLSMNLLLPVVGLALDRGSIRVVMAAGGALLGVSLLGLAAAQSSWTMALLFGGTAALGNAMLGPVAAAKLVGRWFVARRGLALGWANTGSQVGVLLTAPLMALGVDALGWRPSVALAGLIVLGLTVVPVWRVVAEHPADVGERPDGQRLPAAAGEPVEVLSSGWRLLASPRFWALALVVGILITSTIVLAAHLVPSATGRGFERAQSAILLSVFAGSAVPGSIAAGWLADRLELRALLWASLGAQVLGWLGLSLEPGYGALLALVSAIGLCAGGITPIYSALVARVFGVPALGAVMGWVALATLPLSFAGPPAAGAVYDATGSYAALFRAVAVALGIAAVLLVFVRPGRGTR